MSIKGDAVYVEHILDCIDRVEEYVEEGKESFFASSLIQDAVVRNLQVLSESSQRIADSIKEQYPLIPWREISGFRNILVHDYLGLDLGVIWLVIENDLPNMREQFQIIFKSVDS